VVFSKSPKNHARHLTIVLDILWQNQLYAKVAKCEFNKPELQFLGHIVTKHGIRMDPAEAAAISDWPVPNDVHQLQSFLGLTTYLQKVCARVSKLISPMTDLTKGKAPGVWSQRCQKAFQDTKHALTTSPVLVLPDHSKHFEVVCDASLINIGVVLI